MIGIQSIEIASFLGKELFGVNEGIMRPSDLEKCGPGSVIWLRSYSPELVSWINMKRPSLLICDEMSAPNVKVSFIISQNPRLDFIRVLARYFSPVPESGIHHTAIIHSEAVIGARISIGPYSRIGPMVRIGDDCTIGSGVCLEGELVIGKGCHIKSNAVVGAPGFGFERDENGIPIHFPHLGRVELEDGVWLGACTTVERAALGTTRICSNVKVDDLVQIGHNSVTGENTLVMANVVLCGGALVGRDCWIAPNSVIKQKVRIGNRVIVGLGSVVLNDVPDGIVVAGVPAKPLKDKQT